MEKILEEPLKQVAVNDFKQLLDALADEMIKKENASVLLKKEGDQVFVYYPGGYSAQAEEILKASETDYENKKRSGYSREQAFNDFWQAQREISQKVEI